ncbi:expressed unknown protein [Seminavis robusta]|uniref:Uncharacterized protein n=1 Tax=Seminavis robusta TaxID=568900 RepID=A0A9N8H445_9STRA|nr:expressed unknown protein [Seminavis robusta]|eukprot:Sro53_g031371.1  (159) ;mRNA; f:59142-59618
MSAAGLHTGFRASALALLLCVLVLDLHIRVCSGLTIFSLSPQTTPEEVVSAQLLALQRDDMLGVFDFASPLNKANVNNDLNVFDRMVRSGVYEYLVKHQESTILLTMRTPSANKWHGLVRVSTQDSKSLTKEYWWSVSRCKAGPHKGCFMVDAVKPNL